MSADDNDDLILEADSEDIIIEQKETKNLTRCVQCIKSEKNHMCTYAHKVFFLCTIVHIFINFINNFFKKNCA